MCSCRWVLLLPLHGMNMPSSANKRCENFPAKTLFPQCCPCHYLPILSFVYLFCQHLSIGFGCSPFIFYSHLVQLRRRGLGNALLQRSLAELRSAAKASNTFLGSSDGWDGCAVRIEWHVCASGCASTRKSIV